MAGYGIKSITKSIHYYKGDHYMSVQVYINFNGNCREAVELYAEVFKTEKPNLMRYGDAPQDPNFPLTEETKNYVMHTELIISGSKVMFSDTPPEMPCVIGDNFSLTIVSKDLDEIQSSFKKLVEGGTVVMELQETFWSKCYGMLQDKFGLRWQFSLENE